MATHATHPSHPPRDSVGIAAPKARARDVRAALPWLALGAMFAAGALVFWAFDAMPFQDLPAHAGLIALRHRFADSPFEERFFVVAPHVGPYSLFRFLGELFDPALGPTGAVRALATLPLLATPLALLFARYRLAGERSPTFGFVGIALSFGLMTLLGFASYLLGLAVMLVALTLWLELMVRADDASLSTRRQEIVVAVVAPLVFIAHGHAFLLFCALAGVSALATGARVRRLLRLRALAPAIAVAAYAAWLEHVGPPKTAAPFATGGLAPHFQGVWDKLSLLITPTLMTRTGIDFALGVVLWGVVIAATIQTVRWLRGKTVVTAPLSQRSRERADLFRTHARALYACAATIAVVFIALPHSIGWFGFVDGRLVPLVLFLALLAIRLEALGKTTRAFVERGAPAMAATLIVLALSASYRFQSEATGFHEVLARIPEGSRILNLPVDPNSDVFTAHPFIHYDKLALADRPEVVSDLWFHQGSAVFPRPGNPTLRLPPTYSESDLQVIDWAGYHLEDWDYVLMRTRPEAPAPPTPPSLALSEHRGGWWLYKRAPANEGPRGRTD